MKKFPIFIGSDELKRMWKEIRGLKREVQRTRSQSLDRLHMLDSMSSIVSARPETTDSSTQTFEECCRLRVSSAPACVRALENPWPNFQPLRSYPVVATHEGISPQFFKKSGNLSSTRFGDGVRNLGFSRRKGHSRSPSMTEGEWSKLLTGKTADSFSAPCAAAHQTCLTGSPVAFPLSSTPGISRPRSLSLRASNMQWFPSARHQARPAHNGHCHHDNCKNVGFSGSEAKAAGHLSCLCGEVVEESCEVIPNECFQSCQHVQLSSSSSQPCAVRVHCSECERTTSGSHIAVPQGEEHDICCSHVTPNQRCWCRHIKHHCQQDVSNTVKVQQGNVTGFQDGRTANNTSVFQNQNLTSEICMNNPSHQSSQDHGFAKINDVLGQQLNKFNNQRNQTKLNTQESIDCNCAYHSSVNQPQDNAHQSAEISSPNSTFLKSDIPVMKTSTPRCSGRNVQSVPFFEPISSGSLIERAEHAASMQKNSTSCFYSHGTHNSVPNIATKNVKDEIIQDKSNSNNILTNDQRAQSCNINLQNLGLRSCASSPGAQPAHTQCLQSPRSDHEVKGATKDSQRRRSLSRSVDNLSCSVDSALNVAQKLKRSSRQMVQKLKGFSL